MAELSNENSPREYGEGVVQVFRALTAHFGRDATDKEVYRFIWGSPETREWIHKNKGLPENQR